MSQVRLTDEEVQKLIECIQSGAEVPGDLLPKLSPGFFEKLRAAGKFDYKELDKYKIPTIEYAGKRSEAVILAQAAITGGAAPLQVVRNFGENSEGEWRNMIVQGDNLQILKTCYMNQDSLIKDKVKGKVKLIYIDPPFGTGDEYGGSGGEVSYSAKLMGSEFLEALRERLIFLRGILSNDGFIMVRIDYHFGHYVKAILDEIFNNKLRNEIIINKANKQGAINKKFNPATESLFFYSMNERSLISPLSKKRKGSSNWLNMHSPKENNNTHTIKYKKIIFTAPKGRHWTFSQKRIDELASKKRIRAINKDYIDVFGKKQTGMLQYLMCEYETIESNWTDIPSYSFSTKYPTENSEQLLERIINSTTEENDLVLDFFAGSGTTAAVAEKLGRRWIMCDFGKHAIYTIQKRILNIVESKKLNNGEKNEKYGCQPKPFCVVSAGAYDFSKIMNLRDNKDVYVSFVLGLFGIVRESDDFSKKFQLPNIYAEKDGDPVEVYPIWEDEYLIEIRIDKEYLQDIIDASGGKLKGDYYIITPETCTVIGNTILKNPQKEDVQFHMLKFPYKVLEDVSRQFQIEEQPSSSADINKLISSTGFYFNEEVSINLEKVKNGVKIQGFSTMILNSNKELFKELNGLSMILIDNNYDSKVFNMDQAIYAKDIEEDGFVKVSDISDKSAIIAIDKHGNESKIVRI